MHFGMGNQPVLQRDKGWEMWKGAIYADDLVLWCTQKKNNKSAAITTMWSPTNWHTPNIEFVVPGKIHNRHCTPIVTNMCVCVATMRWRFETKSANCLSATPVFSQCDCSSKTIFNLQFVILTLPPLRWKSEIGFLGDWAIFGRRGDD